MFRTLLFGLAIVFGLASAPAWGQSPATEHSANSSAHQIAGDNGGEIIHYTDFNKPHNWISPGQQPGWMLTEIAGGSKVFFSKSVLNGSEEDLKSYAFYKEGLHLEKGRSYTITVACSVAAPSKSFRGLKLGIDHLEEPSAEKAREKVVLNSGLLNQSGWRYFSATFVYGENLLCEKPTLVLWADYVKPNSGSEELIQESLQAATRIFVKFIRVNPAVKSALKITRPLMGAELASCDIRAEALNLNPLMPFEKVDFFRNGEWIGTDSVVPYQLGSRDWAAGPYWIRATGHYENGTSSSDSVKITVREEKPLNLNLREYNPDCENYFIGGKIGPEQVLVIHSIEKRMDENGSPWPAEMTDKFASEGDSLEWKLPVYFSEYGKPVKLYYSLMNRAGCMRTDSMVLYPQKGRPETGPLGVVSGFRFNEANQIYSLCDNAANGVLKGSGASFFEVLQEPGGPVLETTADTLIRIKPEWIAQGYLYVRAGSHTDCEAKDIARFKWLVNPAPTVWADTLISYGGQPAIGKAYASGGTEPYTFTWNTGNCLNPLCGSVLISEFSDSVAVSVSDQNSCNSNFNVIQLNCPTVGLENQSNYFPDLNPGTIPNTLYHAICAGSPVLLKAHTNGEIQGSFSWFKNEVEFQNYSLDSIIDMPHSTIIYKVVLPKWGQCESQFASIRIAPIQTKTKFNFENENCKAHLVDTLSEYLSATLFTAGALQENNYFHPGSIVNKNTLYNTTGQYSLVYTVSHQQYACSTINNLLANWSDIKVVVPPVYVNQALTSYGLAVASHGKPWKGTDKYNYQWFKGGAAFSNGQQMSAPDTLGPYLVVATDSLGCQARDTLTYVFRDMYSTKSIWVKNQSYDTVSIGWDSATSVHHFVVIRENKPITWKPSQGRGYRFNKQLGQAPLGEGHYGIYCGTGGITSAINLVPNKTYFTAVFAWKTAAGDTLWDTSFVQQRFKTKEISIPNVLEVPQITGHSVRLKWKQKPGLGIILAGRKDSVVSGNPIDSVSYAASLSFDNPSSTLSDGSKILYKGNAMDSVMVEDLDSNGIYHFKIWYYREQQGNSYFGSKGKEIAVAANLLNPDSLRLEPDSGYSFSKLTIYGKNLLGTDKIWVGEKTAKIISINGNAAVIMVPLGLEGDKEIKIRKSGNENTISETFFLKKTNDLGMEDKPLQCKTESISFSSTNSILENPLSPPYTPNGFAITPHGEITILVLCRDFYPPNSWAGGVWPVPNQLPLGIYDYFSNEPSEDGLALSVPNFFQTMSLNSPFAPFKVKFKVFPIPIPGNLEGQAIGDFMKIYLEDNLMTDFLDDLDTRRNLPNWMADYSSFAPDGFIDFILDLRRQELWGGAYPGMSTINYTNPLSSTWFSLIIGPKTLRANRSSSCYVGDLNFRPWSWVNNTTYHELAHAFFKSAHVFFNNSLTGDYFASNSGWGMMMANGNVGCNNTSNSWESYLNGWNQPKTISSGNQILKLDDFCHSLPIEALNLNDAIRIKIPKTDQFLWLEYHSKNSAFDYGDNPETHFGDQIISDIGLYGLIEDMGTPTRNVNYGGYQSKANALKSLHKDGNYEFTLGDFPLRSPKFGGGKDLPEYIVSSPRPFSIQNKLTISRLKTPYWPTDYFTFLQSQNWGGPNEVTIPRFRIGSSATEFVGDNLAFGNKENSEILGINSNSPIFNYPKFYFGSQDFDPIILNGLEVEVMPRVPNLPMEVKVRFDKNVFLTNQVLNGFFHLLDLPDLNPDISIGQGVIIRLDKSINPNRTNKGTNNLYPDFITPSRFVIKSNAVLKLEDNATFLIENESGLVIENGATLILGENAQIVVKPGCTFIVHPGAIISGTAGASITVEDQSYYCIGSLSGLLADQVRLGYRLGSISPKLAPYIVPPTQCGTPLQNFKLAFQCNAGVQSIAIQDFAETVDVKLGSTTVFSDVSTIPLSGLADGHYTVIPKTSLVGANGTYSSSFYLFGQSGPVNWSFGDRSYSNIFILNNNLSLTSGKLILEPNTQMYITGTPVTQNAGCPSGTVCSRLVTGGDIVLSGNAQVEVRDGATLQGMCGNMWGGLFISDKAGLRAYNNMIFKDSYEGIETQGNQDEPSLIQLHLFNAKFENNYKSVKQNRSQQGFNFIRNCTFTSRSNEMKRPFNTSTSNTCLKFINHRHVEYFNCFVNNGNFWNNRLEFSQNALVVGSATRSFNAVGNTYLNNYGNAIYLNSGSLVPLNFDRENITLPADQFFCPPDGEEPSNYITPGNPYSKFGFYVEGAGNLPSIKSSIISGPTSFGSNGNFRNVGIYTHGASAISLLGSTLQNLNFGILFYGSPTSGIWTNIIRENTFDNNEQNLRFRSSYLANYKLELKCNRFTTPLSGPAPFAKRYGIYVEAGAGMPDIGGTGVDDNPSPAANWWPSDGTSSSTISPWEPPFGAGLNTGSYNVEYWKSPIGWETVRNLTQNEWKYYRYTNEYFGPFSNPVNIPSFQRITVPRLVVSRVNIPIPNTNPVQYYPNQVNPTDPTNGGMEMDVACSLFGPVLVYPTRQAVAADSSLNSKLQKEPEALEQNIPNPATNSTSIGFTLPSDSKFAKMEVFEITTGRIVKSIGIPATGKGQVEINLSSFAAGIYGYRLVSNGQDIGHKKMIIVK